MASDGTVTIKVLANDSALKDLLKNIKDLKTQLDGLSKVTPFSDIQKGAQSAVQSLLNVSDNTEKVAASLNKVDGDAIDDVSSSASGAKDELMELNFTTDKVDDSLSSFESSAIDDIGDSADTSKWEMKDLGTTADLVDKQVSNIESSSVSDLGSSADRSESELTDMGHSAKKAADEIDKIDPSPVDETEQSTTRLKFSFLDLAKSALVIKAVSVGFDMLKKSVDGAIDRFDTLTIYPRTMKALDFSTGQVDRSMRKLDQGIQGLPTTLNDIVSNTQRIASVTGNLDLATDTALALNNAFLASGASVADTSRGTEQYVQMLSKGKVDMQSWRTLQETMTLSLNRTAKAFKFTGESAQNDLYDALKSGNITFREFNAKLIELSGEVGGFADLAQTNSESIRTAWTNIQTAVVRGTASIITKLDELSTAMTGKTLVKNINGLKDVVNSAFKAIGTGIDLVSPIIVGVTKSFLWMYESTKPIQPLLKGVAAGFAALVVINQVRGYLNGLEKMVESVTAAFVLQDLSLLSSTRSMAKAGLVSKTVATIMAINSGVISWQTVVLGLATKAWVVFKATIEAMTGVVGVIVAAIGILVGVAVLLKNTIGKTSPEIEKIGKEMDEATQSSRNLGDSIDQSSEAFDTNKSRIEGNSQSLRALIKDTEELSQKEFLSAADKKMLKDNVDELNESVKGLGLAYDAEAGSLTMSSQALEQRVKMMEEEEKMAEGQNRLREISEQRAEATAKLDENSRKLDEAQRLLDESGTNWFGKNNEVKKSVTELEEENGKLQERINGLAEDEKVANEMRAESAEAYAVAEEEASNRVITSMEELQGKQKEVAEAIKSEYQGLVQKAQDWSTAIETEYTKTDSKGKEYVASSKEAFNDAKATLEQNVEAMREWSENLEALSKRGIDDGLLEQLRTMGPEGLPLVKGFVDASDEELDEMESLFGESAELSKEALKNGLALEPGTTIEGIEGLVFNTGETLASAVKSSGLAKIVPDELAKSKDGMVEAGKNVAEGAAQGINQGAEGVSRASKDMATKLDDSFKRPLGIHSPSKVFSQHGADLINGLLQGFSQNKPQILSAVRELGVSINQEMSKTLKGMQTDSSQTLSGFTKDVQKNFKDATTAAKKETTEMVNAVKKGMNDQKSAAEVGIRAQVSVLKSGYSSMVSSAKTSMSQVVSTTRSSMNMAVSIMRSTASQAQSAGYNMGIEFRSGLASTQGGIMATARNIANKAASAIKTALKIHSPSRVTAALGKYTGEGMIVGMRDTLSDVERMANEMAMKAMPRVDMGSTLGSIGFGGMGHYSSGESKVITNDNGVTINIETIENNTDSDVPSILEQAAWIVQREEGRLE